MFVLRECSLFSLFLGLKDHENEFGFFFKAMAKALYHEAFCSLFRNFGNNSLESVKKIQLYPNIVSNNVLKRISPLAAVIDIYGCGADPIVVQSSLEILECVFYFMKGSTSGQSPGQDLSFFI